MDSPSFTENIHDIAVEVNHEAWLAWYKTEEWQDKLTEIVNGTLKHIGWNHPSEISILLTDESYSQQLNHTYRKKDSPTNVLSFPAFSPSELQLLAKQQPSLILGDIVLSLETVLKEAEFQKKTFLDHFMHLTIHGTLHLLGYDHQADCQAEEMEAIEVNILSSMGVANPYQ